MSYHRKEGKDKIIFVTKEDHEKAVATEDYEDEQEGLINEDGTINWDCPCLGGMASGPCNVEFRESFTCFHYSTEEPKGAECWESFRTLNDCMMKYPDYYGRRSGSRSGDDEHGEDNDDGHHDDAQHDDDEKETKNEHTESADAKSLQSGLTDTTKTEDGTPL